MLEVRLHDTADDFRRVALDVYRRNPVLSTVELMVLSGRLVDRDPGLFLTVWDGGTAVGAAFQTLHSPLLCSGLGEGTMGAVVSRIASIRSPLSGVHGPLATASKFAAEFRTDVGSQSAVVTRARLQRLHQLRPPPQAAGEARMAAPSDDSLVFEWLERFRADALGVVGNPDVRQGRIAQEAPDQFFFWMVDGEPVSLAGVRVPIVGVSRLGPVFTPDDRRGHGYGSAAAAAATSWALDAAGADEVVLFTDLTNSAVDWIYHRLGFRSICDFARIEFTGQRGADG